MRKKEEKRIAQHLFSFLEHTCVLKIDIPPGFPVLFLSTPELEQGWTRSIAHPALGAGGRGQGSLRAAAHLNTAPEQLFLRLSDSPHFVSQISSHQSHLFLHPAFKIF